MRVERIGEATLYTADVLEALRAMADESVNCVVTSPPYWGLRDYGIAGQLGLEPTPEAYVERMVEVFREVRRLLRADGTCWANWGDSYAGGGRAGKNGQAYGGLEAQNRCNSQVKWGPPTGDIPGLKPKDLCGIPWRVAFALQADGWYLRSDIIWAKPNPMPESVTDRPTKAHEYLFLLSREPRYFYDAEAIREEGITGDMRRPYGSPGANELDPRGKQGEGKLRSKKPDGWDTGPGGHGSVHRDGRQPGEASEIRYGRNRRTVWTIATQPFPEAHFATFPEKLVEPCVLAGCPEGGTVLDPFCGSGTALLVALRLGRRAVGIELKPDYMDMTRKRIAAEAAQVKLEL